MVFHSFGFILVFVPLVVCGYAACGRISEDAAKLWLIASSLVFYGWGDPRSLPILASSVIFNYWISERLGPDVPGSGNRLKLALIANIAALGVFKYTVFATANLNAILRANWSLPAILLPLGISFFTVQQIMFLVDRHQGVSSRVRFLDYALFVSWFPYIVAGPITRWQEVMPQFKIANLRLQPENLARGTTLFVLGLAKKVILSSAFANWADTGFDHPAGLGFLGAWLATASFMLQLYFDFSGYTDMARGVALLMNIQLPENFNDPFRSLSITEFWQRWHKTLTNFITNYIYTPILRARRPTFRRAIFATIITMTITGVWHGATWGLALFGLWHGVGLAVNTMWRRTKKPVPTALAWIGTMAFLLVGFAFFRAHSVSDAWTMIGAMFMPVHLSGSTFLQMIADRPPTRMVSLLAGMAILLFARTASEISAQAQLRPRLAAALAFCFFLCLVLMNTKPVSGFIYRQF